MKKMLCRIGREKIEKKDVIFIALEKLNEKTLLFAQMMLRMTNATAAQSQMKKHASHIKGKTNSKTAV